MNISKIFKGLLAALLLTAGVFIIAGCAAPTSTLPSTDSPAGAPSPPTETPLPIVLKFVEPEDIRMDVTAISAAPTLSISKYVDPDGDFAAYILEGSRATNSFYDCFLNPLLGGISKLEIPVSETTTTYQELFDFGAADPKVCAEVFLYGVRDVKISFADYDFNNNGTTYGCSGHTAALPVCARMWIDDEQYLAWVFDTYNYPDDPATTEDETSVGRGKFKLFYFNVQELMIGADLYERVDYDFEDPAFKRADTFVRILKVSDTENYDLRARVRTTETGLALKQIAEYYESIGADADDGLVNYIAQYREGYNLWSGTFESRNPVDGFSKGNIYDQCAYITTAYAAPYTSCQNVDGVDITVGGIPFLDPFDPAYVAIPGDFPLNPPAGMF